MILAFKKTFQLAEPFIYSVRQKFFYIGYGICRECTEEEIQIYKNFISEYHEVKTIPYLSKANTKKLIELFDQIVNSPICIDTEETEQAKKELAFKLSNDEIQNILHQKDDLQEIYKYKSGKFN